MRRVAIPLLLSLVLASTVGCRKKSAPEYYELESTHSIMVARDGDEAYTSPEMTLVLNGLKAIPADTLEGPKAAALITTIETERTRVQREAREHQQDLEAAEKPLDANPTAASLFGPPPVEGADAGSNDAGGPQRPWAGMTTADFQRFFGNCFSPGPPKGLPGQDLGISFKVNDDPACRGKFGVMDPNTNTFFVFVKDGLAGTSSESRTKTPGTPPPAPPPGADGDAGDNSFMVIPGAPAPAGYTGIPGVPPAAPVAPKATEQ